MWVLDAFCPCTVMSFASREVKGVVGVLSVAIVYVCGCVRFARFVLCQQLREQMVHYRVCKITADTSGCVLLCSGLCSALRVACDGAARVRGIESSAWRGGMVENDLCRVCAVPVVFALYGALLLPLLLLLLLWQ